MKTDHQLIAALRDPMVKRLTPRERDNTKAVIEYMLGRGAFATYIAANPYPWDNCDIRPHVEGLPWNPRAPKRVVSLTLYENRVFKIGGDRRPRYEKRAVPVETVRIPHWDYDGEPPDARERWEREETHRILDAHANYHAGYARRCADSVRCAVPGYDAL